MLPFNLKIIQKRNYKNLRMSFRDSSTLLISAPKHFSKKKCLEFLEQNQSWIEEQQQLWNQRLNLKLPNHQIFLFGEWQNIQDNAIQTHWEECIHSNPTPNTKKALIQFFQNKLNSYLQVQIPFFSTQMKLFPNKILYGKSYKQLACCYHKTKNLRFSLRLALMPRWLINSIIIHELAHIRYPNHQKDFWNLINTYDQNPQKIHIWLREHQDLLLLLHHKIFKA